MRLCSLAGILQNLWLTVDILWAPCGHLVARNR